MMYPTSTQGSTPVDEHLWSVFSFSKKVKIERPPPVVHAILSYVELFFQ